MDLEVKMSNYEIVNALTIDDESVVRCKDCVHCYSCKTSHTGFRCEIWEIYKDDFDTIADGFCHKGERK